MSYKKEFETIELLIESNKVTRGVDAFSLAIIKSERQIRKLFTYLIYQYPEIQKKSYSEIRDVLFKNRNVYFEGFINGFDTIYPIKVNELIGKEFTVLLDTIKDAVKVRNKIFHGQLTDKRLSTNDLINITRDLSRWCELLSKAARDEIGFDGFERNSLRKANVEIYSKFLIQINSLQEYDEFIKTEMSR